MAEHTYPELGIGIGSIGPDARIERGEIELQRLQEFLGRLASGDLFARTDLVIPAMCVDGRLPENKQLELLPNSSGGTFTLVVADALVHGHDGNAAGHAHDVYAQLAGKGYKIGGHDADHASGEGCGCGAEDNLQAILGFIADENNASAIRRFIESLGEHVDAGVHEELVAQAQSLLQSGYTDATGKNLRQAFVDTAGEGSVVTLSGPHNEVALVVNTRAHETYDRIDARNEFGDAYQAFNVDVEAVREGTKIMSETDDDATKMHIAALYYNVAVAAVLAGPDLRVVVR